MEFLTALTQKVPPQCVPPGRVFASTQSLQVQSQRDGLALPSRSWSELAYMMLVFNSNPLSSLNTITARQANCYLLSAYRTIRPFFLFSHSITFLIPIPNRNVL